MRLGGTPPNNPIEIMGSIFGGFHHPKCEKLRGHILLKITNNEKKIRKITKWLGNDKM
jgi:hypothetical protein